MRLSLHFAATMIVMLPIMARAADKDKASTPPLADYFRTETERITAHPLLDINTAEEWKQRRPELRRRLLEMLCLDPMPERTNLHAEVRGVVERPDFIIERLVFQSSPGLYVTGNLYRPRTVAGPLPTILYVCGHGKVEKGGVIYGNKAHYQHHGEWFAANGYVCLVLDTLQLGEVPGIHHGTRNYKMWWWNSKGYTPAGVEVWNGIRAIDYLVSRPEVDASRLGVTGRSGGGAMSWYLGAVDERLKVVVPVAGITDLRDHVIGSPRATHRDGVVEGHCDCMYFVNTYRWDYSMLAALVAPKPLLVVNTDSDPIFPEAGVRRIFESLQKVYDWYGDRDRLGLVIGKGGHVDTEEIRHPSFAWFERWLKDGRGLTLADIKEPARSVPIEALKVLEPQKPLPANMNDTIHETFASAPPRVAPPENLAEWEPLKARWRQKLEEKVFAGWPSKEVAGNLIADTAYRVFNSNGDTEIQKGGVGVTAYDFWAEDHPELRLRIWLFATPGRRIPEVLDHRLVVLGEEDWKRYAGLIAAFESVDGDPSRHPEFTSIKAQVEGGMQLALFAPRGIGPTAWPAEKDAQIRRRFALLGQTLEGMRVLDVRRAVRCMARDTSPLLKLVGSKDSATLAALAAIFEPKVGKLILIEPPVTVRDGPAFLNLDRLMTMPQAIALLYPRPVVIQGSHPEAWAWPRELADHLVMPAHWPTFEPRIPGND